MRDTDLFRMALGIEPRWMATKSDFDAAAKRLDIHLDFARGSRFACPDARQPARDRGLERRHRDQPSRSPGWCTRTNSTTAAENRSRSALSFHSRIAV